MYAKTLIYLIVALACATSAQARTCSVTNAAVAFGVYDPTSTAALDTMGVLDISCDGKFQVTVSLNVGDGVGASYSGGRKMKRIGGAQTLTYNLYRNSSRTQVFGNGSGGSRTLILSNSSHNYSQPIWARIFGNQPLTLPGNYVDTVIVTVSY